MKTKLSWKRLAAYQILLLLAVVVGLILVADMDLNLSLLYAGH